MVEHQTHRVLGHLCGARHEREIARLIRSLLDRNYVIRHFYTDDYSGFREVIPDKYLTQSKRYTTTIEQTNSDVRHWLARFRRRSKVVSQSPEMIAHSLTLLPQFQTNNNIQQLINCVSI